MQEIEGFKELKDLNTFYGVGLNSKQITLDTTNSINNMILNLLTTVPGERLFEPEFGSWLNHFLFEAIDTITASNIREWIIKAIERWIPFIELDQTRLQVIPDLDNQVYRLILYYSIIGTDKAGKLEAGLSA